MIKPTSSSDSDRGAIHWFLGNPVAANIMMMFFILGGLIALHGIQTEIFPPIDPKMITISVGYPGATPYEIADGITSRIERPLLTVEGVKRVSSTAQEGRGLVTVQLKDFADKDAVYNDVRSTVLALQDFPPKNANLPVISHVKLTPLVMTMAVHGDVEESVLRHWTQNVDAGLRALPNIALTKVRGVRDPMISIEVSQATLERHGLTFAEINKAIASYSVDVPAGTIESAGGDWLFRVQEKRRTGSEFSDVVMISKTDGATLRLGDIATIFDGPTDQNLISRFNGKPSAYIDVYRSDTEDTLKIANEVKSYLETLSLPQGIDLTLQDDLTVDLVDRMSLMARNGLLGFMLVFVILLFFLDLKLAFWTSASIPISFLGGLMLLNYMGYSLNMITLFALIVVLGILVDDGIIIGESIFEAQEKEPDNPRATIKGIRSVIAPVTVGVATTIAAFAPLTMSTGVLGQIMKIIPITVICILGVSLIEAYFILPSHLNHNTRWSQGPLATVRNYFQRGLATFTQTKLLPWARLAIRWRYATIAGFVGVALLTVALVTSGSVRFVFFPDIPADKMTISVQLPIGTSFTVTEQTMNTIEDRILAIIKEHDRTHDASILQSISLSIGEHVASQGGPANLLSSVQAHHLGQVRLNLVPSAFRTVGTRTLENEIRTSISDLPNIEAVVFKSDLIQNAPDLEIQLTHADEVVLSMAAADLKEALKRLPGTKDINDNADAGKNELRFVVNERGLAMGLTPAMLGEQLRNAYFGAELQRFQRGDTEVLVYARYPKAEREQIISLQAAQISLPNGQMAPLTEVADTEVHRGFAKILTVDGRRILTITAEAALESTTPGDLTMSVTQAVMPPILQRYPGLKYSFEGKTKEQSEDLQSLLSNMLIAFLLIYVLLGAQLRSYIQPLAIMSAIPFGIVGAVLGHWLLGYDLTFISLFGVIALTGVVVNDSIVLVDNLNQHRKDGYGMEESAMRAIERRFRPILLTTLSTSFGLLPILMETSIQARFLIPMVVSLACGILFATVIVLFLIPCLMVMAEDACHWLRARFMEEENAGPISQ